MRISDDNIRFKLQKARDSGEIITNWDVCYKHEEVI